MVADLNSEKDNVQRIQVKVLPSSSAAVIGLHYSTERHGTEERVREIEHASFSPLVFSTSGGMGASTTVYLFIFYLFISALRSRKTCFEGLWATRSHSQKVQCTYITLNTK